MRNVAITSVLVLVSTLVLHAQSSPPSVPQWQIAAGGKMAFDVASIKPSTCPRRAVQFQPGGRIVAPSVPAKILIGIAYGLPFSAFGEALIGATDWVDSRCFSLEAHAEGNPSQEQMALMMQSLLAARFKLAVHWETRQLPVYALVVAKPGKTGAQLMPHATDNSTCRDRDPKVQEGASVAAPPCGGGFAISPGHIVAEATMVDLAKAISWFDQIDRAVVDRTGLSGVFDLTVNYERSVPGPQAGIDASTDSSLPSTIFTALQEQLGLKLESQKGPVDVLVIDHVQMPSEN